MKFPSPKIIWWEMQLNWYVQKLEELSDQVAIAGKSMNPDDRRLIEKVQTPLNKTEARFHRVSKMLAEHDRVVFARRQVRAEAERLESEVARHTDGERRARQLRAAAEDLQERAARNIEG